MNDDHKMSNLGGESLSERRTSLAEMRNRMAAERTLMGWMRTSVSLITFGFSISQFFQYLQEKEPQDTHRFAFREPYLLGIILVCLGTFALMMALIENYLIIDRLTKKRRIFLSRWSVASVSAIILVLIGLILFGVLVRSL